MVNSDELKLFVYLLFTCKWRIRMLKQNTDWSRRTSLKIGLNSLLCGFSNCTDI